MTSRRAFLFSVPAVVVLASMRPKPPDTMGDVFRRLIAQVDNLIAALREQNKFDEIRSASPAPRT